MRPLCLTIEGFGSFAQKQVIDFAELAQRRLFLIHGPTGSGKTTVLDAICFALYGDTTGGERDGKGMRSDFVGPDVETQVTLDFEVGLKIYRVWRQPAYERAKLRGEGVTQTLGKAELWDRTNAQSTEDEGALLATGLSNVSSMVEQVLGFRSEQFRQVIVLPQGQFRDLLLAKSKEREEILQQLFDTSFYAQIQEELKLRGKALRDQAAELRTRWRLLLEQVGAEDEAHLRLQAKEVEADRILAEKTAVSLATKATKATKALERAESDHLKFGKLEEAETVLEALLGEANEIKQAKSRLEAARRADRLEDVAEALGERRLAADEAKKAAEKSEEARSAATSMLEEASRALKKAESRDSERKTLREKLTEMRRVRPILEQLTAAITDREKAQRAHAEATAQLDNEEQCARELEETIEQTEAAISATQQKLGERAVIAAALEKAGKALTDREALDKALVEEKALIEARVSAEADVEAGRKEIATAKSELSKLLKAREASSAALLAKELAPGEPCPVCGSKKHPAPAKSRRKVPAEEDVADAQAALETAETSVEDAREALDQAKNDVANLGGELRALKKALGKAADKALHVFQEEQAAAVAALSQHDRDKVRLERNRENLVEDKKLLKALGARITQTRKQADTLARTLATAAATLKAREEQVPDEWRDLDQLDRSIGQSEDSLEALDQDLKQAAEAEKKAQLEATRATSELKSAAKQQHVADKAMVKAQAEWQKRLAEAGFPTEADYCEALLPDVEIDGMQASIERYEHNLVAAQTTAKNAKNAVEGLKRPDMEALAASADEAEKARGQAADDCARLASRGDAIEKTLASLEAVSEDLVEVEHRFGVMGRISGVANGDNKHRISLQRFVLAARLDDVLACASKRLSLMSRGRYLLRRNISAEDRRSAGGLELEIEDAYTAKSRPVSTLSGGESFQAALSLALGLSEVVQAYAGGIRLDTIFVDEGFGSLDPEALDLAINTLIDLQQSGRMVGVISHVPELKERIDVRLEISAGKSGSRAQFRLP